MSTHTAARFIDDEEDVVIRFDDDEFSAGGLPVPPQGHPMRPVAGPLVPVRQSLQSVPVMGLDDEVHDAEEEIEQLRQRQERLQRQKMELEEMSRRREEYEQARTDVEEKLVRYVGGLEKEIIEAKKWATDCADLREVLEHHLCTVRSQRSDSWQRGEQRERIGMAMREIETARAEIVNGGEILKSLQKARGGRAVIKPLRASVDDSEFLMWFKRGIAFTMPAILFATVVMVIYALFV